MWCPKCKARILTTGQMIENKPCKICQKEEHARTLKNRIDNEIRKKNDNV